LVFCVKCWGQGINVGVFGITSHLDTLFDHTPCYNHLKTSEYLIITFSTFFFLCVCDQIICLNLCIHTKIVHLRDMCILRGLFSKFLLHFGQNIKGLGLIHNQHKVFFNSYTTPFYEFCSSPSTFCSRPTDLSIIPLRELSHAPYSFA
jgi:hypothetical protein